MTATLQYTIDAESGAQIFNAEAPGSLGWGVFEDIICGACGFSRTVILSVLPGVYPVVCPACFESDEMEFVEEKSGDE